MNLYHRAMDFARNLFGWAVVGAIHAGFLIIIGFFLNWMGVGGINYIFTAILIPVLAGLFLAPEITVNLLAAAVTSGILFPASVEDEVKKYFTTYLKNVQGVILWLSLVFIFLATVPVGECPIAFFALVSTLMLIAIAVSYWKIEGPWAKRLTYFGLIFLTIIMIGKLVPNSTYIKVFGTTPAAFLDSSKEDEQAKKLDDILKTLKKNPNDKVALANLKNIQDEMSRKSLLGKTVSMGEKIKDALKTPAPASITPPQAKTETASNAKAETKKQQAPAIQQIIIKEVIKANIPEPGGVETKRLQPGKYRLEPTDTIIRLKSEAQRRASGGWLVLNQNELVFFSLPPEKWETTKGEVKIIPQ